MRFAVWLVSQETLYLLPLIVQFLLEEVFNFVRLNLEIELFLKKQQSAKSVEPALSESEPAYASDLLFFFWPWLLVARNSYIELIPIYAYNWSWINPY